MRFLISMLLLLVSVKFSQSQVPVADISMRFHYEGIPPTPREIVPNRDAEFCGKHKLLDESLLVNPVNKGIKNVIVYVDTGRGRTELPKIQQAAVKHRLQIKNCRYQSRVVLAKVGDTLTIEQQDPVGHNPNVTWINRPPSGLMIRPKQALVFDLDESEPVPVFARCNIHPWMLATILVLDHPFSGVTDENGVVKISGIPAGQEIVFRVFHERGNLSGAELAWDGRQTRWKRARFKRTLVQGHNDLGTVTIPAIAFDRGAK